MKLKEINDAYLERQTDRQFSTNIHFLSSSLCATYLQAGLHGGKVSKWHLPRCHLPQGHCKTPHV